VSIVSFVTAVYLVNMSLINQALEKQGDPNRVPFPPSDPGLFFRVISAGFGVMDVVFLAIVRLRSVEDPEADRAPARRHRMTDDEARKRAENPARGSSRALRPPRRRDRRSRPQQPKPRRPQDDPGDDRRDRPHAPREAEVPRRARERSEAENARHDDPSIGLYATQWGFPFAIGFVLLILIHELGHVYVLRRRGSRRRHRSSSRSWALSSR
jgi:hypothetical protein